MSVPHRVRGVRILKAVSSPLRLQILNLLFDKGPLAYTELMSSLKMNPTRDAGRFAYHLKFLLKADLIEADAETKKYCLTDLGEMVIEVAERIEKRTLKPRGMLVRTSKFTLEEFDVSKIANSLIRETKMPAELAQKVAKEAEKRLLKSKPKYLTAPLVREVVNTILIEKGLEEYRHKLTRLGLPVYDVAALVDLKSKTPHWPIYIHETAGDIVLKEFMLLNVFPRDIADAHLSGSMHISGLGSWILKPSEIVHDLRFFFQNGLKLEKINASQPSFRPPKNLETTLSIIFNVLLHSSKEICETQTLEYFNIFLAPFVKGLNALEVKEALRIFILNLNQHVNASISLEPTIPDFIADKPAAGISGKLEGNYRDFYEESQNLASLLLDIFIEESVSKPLLNPKLILKIRPETFNDEKAKAILVKAHQLASQRGIPYFANLLKENERQSVFSTSGFRLGTSFDGDWEIDTLRTGKLAHVTLNLPRIAYECEGDKAKFFQILKERFDLALQALEIKHKSIKQHGKGLLPFLLQDINGDRYFRNENCSCIINLAGLRETIEAFYRKKVGEDERTLKFAQEIIENILDYTHKIGRRCEKHLVTAKLPDFEASERLARLDIERFGVAKVRFLGTREKPYYSTVSKLVFTDGKISTEFLKFEQEIQRLYSGGNLTVIELGDAEHKPEELMALTKQIFEGYDIKFFTYDRKLTYCLNCRKSWFGILHKCSSCGAIDTLTPFDRFASV
ncbi:MAG: anaerobic ribonucleoside-triphosphate reductase [Candidatus Bathyarchaeota archaeon]|nr:anaerobic ribonucleoside-triphosphate reductase [Candidatus Bathyarchaeota archaeon]